MLVDKYVICLPKARRHVCRAMGLPDLRDADLSVLYAIKRLERATASSIHRYLDSHGHPMHRETVLRVLPSLVSSLLIVREGDTYSLSVTGRHFISRIRNYLLRKRL
jgi:predicted transcriptional regulator